MRLLRVRISRVNPPCSAIACQLRYTCYEIAREMMCCSRWNLLCSSDTILGACGHRVFLPVHYDLKSRVCTSCQSSLPLRAVVVTLPPLEDSSFKAGFIQERIWCPAGGGERVRRWNCFPELLFFHEVKFTRVFVSRHCNTYLHSSRAPCREKFQKCRTRIAACSSGVKSDIEPMLKYVGNRELPTQSVRKHT